MIQSSIKLISIIPYYCCCQQHSVSGIVSEYHTAAVASDLSKGVITVKLILVTVSSVVDSNDTCTKLVVVVYLTVTYSSHCL